MQPWTKEKIQQHVPNPRFLPRTVRSKLIAPEKKREKVENTAYKDKRRQKIEEDV